LTVNLRAGKVETIVATQGVTMTQGARVGKGQNVRYTAATGDIVLSGTPDAPAELREGADLISGICSLQIQANGNKDVKPCPDGSLKSSSKIQK
jgi:hypothetical protein